MQSDRKFIKNTRIFSAVLLTLQTDVFAFYLNAFQFPLKKYASKIPPQKYPVLKLNN